ncbi:MAG: hypothetical protein JO190_12400 [Candidatus Eremiobacteraeota bacterium]|nr:hypothetical protein [Candidatus Eremiobacteraeota bacterium]MBV8498158.1 hypothetical protein [Candidatus Eremiobacteraeota bacterium]
MRTTGWAACIALAFVALASCSHGTQTKTQPAASATASPAATAAATAPVITPRPAPSGRPTEAAAPRLTHPVPRVAPDAAPQILAIAVSETTVRPGDRVSGSVVTSSNVASVEARIGGYAMSMSKTGVGRFALTYTVAPLPWFVRGNFTLQVIARNARGDAATRAIPLTVR